MPFKFGMKSPQGHDVLPEAEYVCVYKIRLKTKGGKQAVILSQTGEAIARLIGGYDKLRLPGMLSFLPLRGSIWHLAFQVMFNGNWIWINIASVRGNQTGGLERDFASIESSRSGLVASFSPSMTGYEINTFDLFFGVCIPVLFPGGFDFCLDRNRKQCICKARRVRRKSLAHSMANLQDEIADFTNIYRLSGNEELFRAHTNKSIYYWLFPLSCMTYLFLRSRYGSSDCLAELE